VLEPVKGHGSLLLTEDEYKHYLLEGQHHVWVDADEALTLLKEAERIGRTSHEALARLEQAAQYLNQGMFLDGEEGLWASGKRATIEGVRYRCRLWLAEAYEQQGMPGQAEMVINTLVEEDPLDEDALCRLMELFHRQGMTHKALRLYEQSVRVFEEEMGAKLGASTTTLANSIREQQKVHKRLSNSPIASVVQYQQTQYPFSSAIIEATQLSGTQDMEPSRRNLLQAFGILGAELFISPQIQGHSSSVENQSLGVSQASFASLATITQRFRAMQRQGDAFIAGGIKSHIQTIQEALEHTLNDNRRYELWRVLAQTQTLAGFHFTKKKERGRAKTFLEAAVTSAQVSGDALLIGASLGHLAQFSLREEQNLKKAKQLLRQAQEFVPIVHPLNGWFVLVMASLAAKEGRKQQCEAVSY